jgi:hypothetical protein
MPVREPLSRCGALVIDSMPPATTIGGRAGLDGVVAEHHRLHARAADLVDGHGAGGDRDAGGDRGLARRRLAEAGRQHAAHDHFRHRFGRNARLRERGLDGGSAEGGGGNTGELTQEGAERGALGADDDDIGHGRLHKS